MNGLSRQYFDRMQYLIMVMFVAHVVVSACFIALFIACIVDIRMKCVMCIRFVVLMLITMMRLRIYNTKPCERLCQIPDDWPPTNAHWWYKGKPE